MKAKPAKRPGAVSLELDQRDEPLMNAAARSAAIAPFRLKKILVPIDFSDCSKKALQYAIPLAKEHGARITLLYVVPTSYAVGEYGGYDHASILADMRTSGKKEIDRLAKDMVGGEVPVNTIVSGGAPAREIIKAAKAAEMDVIVLSTHGRTGLKHVFLGSVTENVVRQAPCPVLVVREREHEFVVA
jgi:nucleotide-binding universal stress UspA family protein